MSSARLGASHLPTQLPYVVFHRDLGVHTIIPILKVSLAMSSYTLNGGQLEFDPRALSFSFNLSLVT